MERDSSPASEWPFPTYSMQAALEPWLYTELPAERASKLSWRLDFGVPINSFESLTKRLDWMKLKMGYETFDEMFASLALQGLFSRFGSNYSHLDEESTIDARKSWHRAFIRNLLDAWKESGSY